jgi:hypothetical protein
MQAGVFCRSAPRLLGNCVVTHLYNHRGAVFSVLRGPCRNCIRESNSEASSCGSTEEYKDSVAERKREREWSESSPVLVICEVGRLAIAL